MSLIEYNKKRNFKSTNEPKGKQSNQKTNIFVIQYHQARAKHYDFRLEYNGVLVSWAIPKGLSFDPKKKNLAVHVEDHPIDYAKFEGIIPKGNYGAGTVDIIDSGNYTPLEDFDNGFKKGHLKIFLNGKRFKGAWSLIKFKENNWFIIKANDEFSKIEKEKNLKLPFKTASVQLATLSHKVPAGKDWLYEIKYDGYRMLSFIETKKVKMVSRNNIDYTKKLITVAENLKKLDYKSLILDGEIVCFDKNGKSDFELLQNNLKNKKANFYYCVFDLLALNGEDLRELPLIKRKQKLERVLFKAESNILYSSHTYEGKKSFEFAKQNNLEGIIAKNINSKYTGKRTNDWLKIKCYLRQEFIIAGYTTSEKNNILSALLLGYFKDNNLIYVGKVGTGFKEEYKQKLVDKIKSSKINSCPFQNKINIANAVWLKPKFIAEIQYTELTKDKLLRQPSFISLREDKNINDIILEI